MLVAHRGRHTPENRVAVRQLHVGRADFASAAERIREFAPAAVVDTLAMTRADAEAVLPHLPDGPIVVLTCTARTNWPSPVAAASRYRSPRTPRFGRGATRTGARRASMATTSTWTPAKSSTWNRHPGRIDFDLVRDLLRATAATTGEVC
ncbi:hypothetical protein A8924_2562 [Saccharopolyspora erythraea NRRL 2338]|uniref:Uncharacterized protein n=1 Tax=Saccharopolyspora erythraea TaxID=1836 RepID=A0ABN1CN65_SACER|nr:hypothetical protein [Saccharopolyspora erythraea]EQD87555.1 hypothetical protein N599_03880 [Saccharopolyspora erythraea D]PFG95247.1 hypothetical protein A8924_2562 [Saccharopolyspora erythraea NRRL 2338]QRK91900.1 hypothetical protein JQX30_11350 [Saccharopolyspora erythraea]